MEFITIAFLAAGIVLVVWIVWKVRVHDRMLENATLDQAWRIVLTDPHYAHRREYEERRHELEAQLRKAKAGL